MNEFITPAEFDKLMETLDRVSLANNGYFDANIHKEHLDRLFAIENAGMVTHLGNSVYCLPEDADALRKMFKELTPDVVEHRKKGGEKRLFA